MGFMFTEARSDGGTPGKYYIRPERVERIEKYTAGRWLIGFLKRPPEWPKLRGRNYTIFVLVTATDEEIAALAKASDIEVTY